MIDPETEFQTVVLRERGNVGMHVVDVDPIKYFYTEYEVKIQVRGGKWFLPGIF